MGLHTIKGQAGAVEVVEHALRNDRLAHAYLFVGPSGVGKLRLARALARAKNCAEDAAGCGRCESCRRIDADKHPDVRVFHPREEGNRNLQVELVRSDILPFVKFAPFEGRAAFLIFPHADVSFPVHHPEAANAMLKTLEEPRGDVHFVLTSERPDSLLPTIRSRCQRVRFGALPAPILDSILEQHAIAAERRPAAVALAQGRADRALALCDEGRAQELLQWAERIDAALDAADSGELIGLAEELARHDQRTLIMETLALFYRDVAALGLGLPDGNLAFRHRLDNLQRCAARLSPGRAAERVAQLQQLEADIERNANPQLALDALLLGMAAAR
jgi:DNA polymerase-3 subunit delta'